MKPVYILIGDAGDGSNTIQWYKGSEFTYKEIHDAAELDKYDSYQSGDGIQIKTLYFEDTVNLDNIIGIDWEKELPGEDN